MRSLVLVATLLGTLSVPQTAEAKRGIAIINTGNDCKKLADVKEEFKSQLPDGAHVGYVYERFGIFWIDFWRWNGRFALCKDGSYGDSLSKEQLEEVANGSISRPWTYHLPPGLVILIGIVILVVVVMLLPGGDDDEDDTWQEE